MTKHHYLPACYLARFSTQNNVFPLRERSLFVGDLIQKKIFKSRASNVGCINNLYRLYNYQYEADLLENIWSKYEKDLPKALENLINGKIDAESWVRILVPFVGGLFVRGLDFRKRFKQRLNYLGLDTFSNKEFNDVSLIELQRLLAPIISAKWIVIKITGHEPLITNDLGYSPFFNPFTNDNGIAIPLDLKHVLAISPVIEREIIKINGEKWEPIVEYVNETPDNHQFLNRTLSSFSQRFIFGPNELVIQKNLDVDFIEHDIPEPVVFGFVSEQFDRAYEFTWHRLVSVLSKNPRDYSSWDFSIDWNIVKNGWHSLVIFPTNLVEFPSALRRKNNGIYIKFYNPKIYYSISHCLNFFEMGEFQNCIDETTKVIAKVAKRKYKYDLLMARSEAFSEIGDYEKAFADIDYAIKLYPKKSNAYTCQGNIYSKIGDHKNAIIMYSKAIEFDLTYLPAVVNRAICYFKSELFEVAMDDINNALQKLPSGQEAAKILKLRGIIHMKRNELDNALADFSNAIQMSTDDEEKASLLYLRAVTCGMTNEEEKAIFDLNQAYSILPSNYEISLLLVQLLMKNDNIEMSIKLLDEMLLLPLNSSTKAEIFEKRAICLTLIKDFKSAYKDYDKAFKSTNDSQLVSYHCGMTNLFQGNLDDSIKDFKSSLEINPNHTASNNNIGVSYALKNDHQNAIFYFDKAIESRGELGDIGSALRNKSISQAKLKNFDLAEESLDNAIELIPNSILAEITRGRIFWHKGDYENSILIFQNIHLGENDDIDNPFLALPLFSSGKKKDSLNLVEKWIKNDPFPIERMNLKSDFLFMKQKIIDHDPIFQKIIILLN